MVNLDVPDEVILSRISDRWIHLPSGRVYNTSYNRPKVAGLDDETGEALTKRPDDNPVRLCLVPIYLARSHSTHRKLLRADWLRSTRPLHRYSHIFRNRQPLPWPVGQTLTTNIPISSRSTRRQG